MSAERAEPLRRLGAIFATGAMILQLMVVDRFRLLPYWQDRDASLRSPVGGKIEGVVVSAR